MSMTRDKIVAPHMSFLFRNLFGIQHAFRLILIIFLIFTLNFLYLKNMRTKSDNSKLTFLKKIIHVSLTLLKKNFYALFCLKKMTLKINEIFN